MMGKIFDMHSPFMRFLAMIGNLFLVNFLFLVCCIPVVTVGAAFAALNKVAQDVVADQGDANVWKPFWTAFRENFKQATIAWLMILVLAAVILLNALLSYSTGTGSMAPVSQGAMWVAFALLLAVSAYLYAIMVRFENRLGQHLRNAVILALMNMPRTILITALNLVPFVIVYTCTLKTILNLGFYWLLIGPALCCAFASWILRPVFAKFEPGDIEN